MVTLEAHHFSVEEEVETGLVIVLEVRVFTEVVEVVVALGQEGILYTVVAEGIQEYLNLGAQEVDASDA